MSITVNSATTASAANGISTKSNKNELSINDFFTLLAAQLSNQNMMNPVDNNEFMAQMAQFSALSATQELGKTFTNFMAVSYIGKNVTASQTDTSGKTTIIEGIAEKVEFINNNTYITVNGTKITPDQITQITNAEAADAKTSETSETASSI